MTQPTRNAIRLGLGTVQFGLDYGISNMDGRTPVGEAGQIVEMAAEAGVRIIDTAAEYGESEKVLGKILPIRHRFQIVTKAEQFGTERITPKQAVQLTDSFQRSLENLRCDSVYGLLIHNVDDLLTDGGELLLEALLDLKSQGLVEKVGASVYTGVQIDFLLSRFSLELIQLPLNVFDQRLVEGGYLTRLKDAGVEIHARSVFLQGLLLMDPDELPSHFDSVRNHLREYQQANRRRGLTPLQASLGFVLGHEEIDCAVVGVCSYDHWLEVLEAVETSERKLDNGRRFACHDEEIIDPTRWRADLDEARVARW